MGVWAPCVGRCWRCSAPLEQISVLVADADQAFEACGSQSVLASFWHFALSFAEVSGTQWVHVACGSRFKARLGTKGFGANGYNFHLDKVMQALAAVTSLSLVMYGNLCFELKGLPIGGVCSAICVALVLGCA